MAGGNPRSGLLKAMIDLMNDLGPAASYDSDSITWELERRGQWDGRPVETPERTVNSYFSQHPEVFHHTGRNRYAPKLEHVRLREVIMDDDENDEPPSRVEQRTYRVSRDSDLVRRLKALYGDRCQLCDSAIQLSDRTYSEAHHIKPLGVPHSGPDVAGNILILCPNHHVMCDYGAVRLVDTEIRAAVQHEILAEYLDYHNERIARESPGTGE